MTFEYFARLSFPSNHMMIYEYQSANKVYLKSKWIILSNYNFKATFDAVLILLSITAEQC